MTLSTTNQFLQKVRQTIIAHHLLEPGNSLLVAVSGGPDSVALLHSLVMLSKQQEWRLGIAHLNHNLRTDAARDASFVDSLAKKLDLPCYVEKKNVAAYRKKNKLSLEEAARDIRLRFLHQTARTHQYQKIAMGHHADDNAELILMNFLRGSGLKGLIGMAPQRNLSIDGTHGRPVGLVRPLIQCKRKEILAFLAEQHCAFVHDITNDDLRYRRNRIRHELIPLIERFYNPNIVDTVNRMADVMSSEKSWITEMAVLVRKEAVLEKEGGKIKLSISKIIPLPTALLRQVLRDSILEVKGTLRKITYTHIMAAIHLIKVGPTTGTLDLPDRLRVTREKDILSFVVETVPLRHLGPRHLPINDPDFEYSMEGPGSIFIKELGIRCHVSEAPAVPPPESGKAGQNVAFFDMDIVSYPLMIRKVRNGDRFTPLGMTGTQKIHKFFSDHKVPLPERQRCPVLVSGSCIIWVVGHRLNDWAKVTTDTKRILKVAFCLA